CAGTRVPRTTGTPSMTDESLTTSAGIAGCFCNAIIGFSPLAEIIDRRAAICTSRQNSPAEQPGRITAKVCRRGRWAQRASAGAPCHARMGRRYEPRGHGALPCVWPGRRLLTAPLPTLRHAYGPPREGKDRTLGSCYSAFTGLPRKGGADEHLP